MLGKPWFVKQVLYSEEALAGKVRELAARIDRDYADAKQPIVCVGILKAFIFMSDLCRALKTPHRVEFMAVSSYQGTSSSGTVKIVMDLRQDIQGHHVIIIEDILDTGRTLHYLVELMKSRNPLSVECCTLLTKPAMKKVDITAKYVGFEMDPPLWVVGYGLDYNEKYRTLPYIAEMHPDAVEKESK